ncbi:2-oxoadipate dioxygenase/decarboxylase HglS [Oceanisphaera sp. W20_SRM_FM3]|uniref:2-oxoadipate dioxygenase/decarboxylase HglS n=1 Tax=Oceanisphaera sp. W20_SRM_FM3 TaxID=3240267 RepID=UPI003F9DD9E0
MNTQLTAYVTTDHIRDLFSSAMSAMYQAEVPQYATLLKLVAEVNQATLAKQPALAEQLKMNGELARLNVERHGAIRLGTAAELGMMRRLFAVLGMQAVGYYDLAVAGVPVHSTAFRPTEPSALARNPFRIFTSLLRLELIENLALREQAAANLAKRDIFTPRLRALIRDFDRQGGLTEPQAREFVIEALETFRWHATATVDLATYQELHQAHPLIADVVCFNGPHINHLTPRTLDIDEAQLRMPQMGMVAKALIEGPPQRHCPILLRQTSFKAQVESIVFADGQVGAHSARFGEIEQRGAALTAKGRALYDALLTKADESKAELDNVARQRQLAAIFSAFTDDEATLRRQGLAFFHYQLTSAGEAARGRYLAETLPDKEQLLEQGLLSAAPLTYEDFLPVSAAGIFQSNLGANKPSVPTAKADIAQIMPFNGQEEPSNSQIQFEQALGCAVIDPFTLYAQQERQSYAQAMQLLLKA